MIINAIITAGGKGSRFSKEIKKQFFLLEEKPIIIHTLDKFINITQISKLIITSPLEDKEYILELIDKYYKNKNITVVVGGKERQNSVYNGLLSCDRNCDYVLIHDAVRPFVKIDDILKLIREVKSKKAVIPVSPVVDTIKEVESFRVKKTLVRDVLYKTYTPQIFSYSLIKEIHEKAVKDNFLTTDDASLCEKYNVSVYTIITSSNNIKITDFFDVKLAEFIIKSEINS